METLKQSEQAPEVNSKDVTLDTETLPQVCRLNLFAAISDPDELTELVRGLETAALTHCLRDFRSSKDLLIACIYELGDREKQSMIIDIVQSENSDNEVKKAALTALRNLEDPSLEVVNVLIGSAIMKCDPLSIERLKTVPLTVEQVERLAENAFGITRRRPDLLHIFNKNESEDVDYVLLDKINDESSTPELRDLCISILMARNTAASRNTLVGLVGAPRYGTEINALAAFRELVDIDSLKDQLRAELSSFIK